MQGRLGGSWGNYYFICQIAMVLPSASFPPCLCCLRQREGRGEVEMGQKRANVLAAAASGVWLGLAQHSVRRRVSAALAQVFNVSSWNVLNTTFYKGTLVKHPL